MPVTGLSNFYYAKYANNGGTVTYSDGGSLGKATTVNIAVTTSSSKFYADNAVADVDRTFASGTITVGTSGLGQDVSKAILGVREATISDIDGVTDSTAKELIFDDTQDAPYLGFGLVEQGRADGKTYHRAVVLCKVAFSTPADAANTRGEQIEWQTPTIEGEILRSDAAGHAWKMEATFTTEAQAVAYIKARLSIE